MAEVLDFLREQGMVGGIMTTTLCPPAVGEFRSFGLFGPKYEIKRIRTNPATGQRVCDIRVLESGEEATILLERVSEDPEAF